MAETRAPIVFSFKGFDQLDNAIKKLQTLKTLVNDVNKVGGAKTGGGDRAKQLTSQSNVLNQIEKTRDRINQLDVKGTRLAAIKGRLTRAEKAVRRGDLVAAKQILAASEKRITILSRESNANKKKLKDLRDQTRELEKQRKAIEEAGRKIRRRRIADKRRVIEESPGFRFAQFRRNRTASDRRIRRDTLSSAAIGGAFPLLFGQGGGASVGGALGGFAGGILGGQAGFALSLVGTQIGSIFDNIVNGAAELGRAIGPFTQDVQAVTTALGLQGSAQEAQLKRIERTQGKTAAFNAAMKMMENRIGESGVRKIKEFGETTRILGTIFGTALLKLQAFAAGVVDFVAKLLAGEQKLKEAEINKAVADAAAGGNKEAKALLAREEEIQRTGFTQTSVRSTSRRAKPGTKDKIDELKRDKEIFAIRNKISLSNDEITSKSQTLVEEKRKEFELNQKIKNLVDGGMNPALAKSLATVEQTFDEEQKILEEKAKQAEEDLRKAIAGKEDLDTQKLLKDEFLAHTIELGKHNKLRKDAVKLTKDLHTQTDEVGKAFEKLSESINNDIKEGIKGLIKGTSTLGDLLNNVADRFLDVALNQALFGSILGVKGEKGGGLLGAIGLFANGGRPPVGKPSIVGEKGPELFVPRSSGTIVPNNKLGGGGSTSVVVNVDASGSDVQGDDAGAKELGTLISVAVQGELLKQQRPGGLLSSLR